MSVWHIATLVAIILGVYAAYPQLHKSFTDPESLSGLSIKFTGAILANNLIMLAMNIHYNLPYFVFGGILNIIILSTLISRQIMYRRKRA